MSVSLSLSNVMGIISLSHHFVIKKKVINIFSLRHKLDWNLGFSLFITCFSYRTLFSNAVFHLRVCVEERHK